MSQAYKQAGVDIHAGYEVVNRIKKHTRNTNRLGVMSDIGAFGGLFNLAQLNYKEPVLVSGTDGVGTKLLVAIEANKHDTIGIDVVAMCVNDIVAQGAQPLFFLDYLAVGKNNPKKIEQIVKGVSDGCIQSHCALIGGETAEMPDMYTNDHYDIAGFAVGVVEKSKIIDGSKTKAGDVIIGLSSSGIHSNGYSLVRKIIQKDHQLDLNTFVPELNDTIANTLLTPTKIYVKSILTLLETVDVHGIAHITGGGFDENIPRCLNEGLGIKIDTKSFEKPAIFNYLKTLGNLEEREMYNVFNMGIGMVVIVDPTDAPLTLSILKECGETAQIIGHVTATQGVELL